MARVSGRLRGVDKVTRAMKKLGAQGMASFQAAVYAEGLSIIDEAVQNVPKVTGRLANSHWVSYPDLVTGKVVIGFATKYAATVEHGLRIVDMPPARQRAAFARMREMGWRKSRVGGPFFFRNAINSHKPGMTARIAKTALRYYKLRIGMVTANRPDEPKSEIEAYSKGERNGK